MSPSNEPSATPERRRDPGNPVGRLFARHWGALLLAIVLIVFVLENRRRVSINLLATHVRSPLWLVLVVTALIGLAIGYLLARQRARRD